jgi:hypothetical protein
MKMRRTENTKQYFVTVNGKPYGAVFAATEEVAIRIAKAAKAELPNADVVAWQTGDGGYDAIPEFVRLTAEQRAEAWVRNPPKPMAATTYQAKQLTPEALQFQAEYETVQRKKTTRRIHEMLVKKQAVKSGQDTIGKTWNQKYCRWEVDLTKTPQENQNMAKFNIIPYDAAGTILERGKTSINADMHPDEIFAKMEAAAKRAGKRAASVKVYDADGFVHRDWTIPGVSETAAEIDTTSPVPVNETESAMPAKKTKTAKSNGATKKAGNGTGKKPGVISTIVDMLGRASGTTVEECLDRLKEKFPDRKRESMMTTCKIQLARNAKSKDKSETRGLIYYGSK